MTTLTMPTTLTTSATLPAWLKHHPALWQADTLDRAALRAAAAELRQHSAFPQAAQQFAGNMLDTFQTHRPASKVMTQQSRFAFLAFVLALHHTRDPNDPASGVTYTRLKEFFAKDDLASATRLKTMLRMARIRGQLSLIPTEDKRLRVLAPTEKLIRPALIWLNAQLQAIALVKPLPQPPDALTANPHFVSAVLTYNVHAYAKSKFMLHEDYPEIRTLMSHEHGYVVVMSLLKEMQSDNEGNVVSALPIGKFALRYATSRSGVRNLLQLAEARGWLSLPVRGGHMVTLRATFAEKLQQWVALEMEWSGEFARLAVDELAINQV